MSWPYGSLQLRRNPFLAYKGTSVGIPAKATKSLSASHPGKEMGLKINTAKRWCLLRALRIPVKHSRTWSGFAGSLSFSSGWRHQTQLPWSKDYSKDEPWVNASKWDGWKKKTFQPEKLQIQSLKVLDSLVVTQLMFSPSIFIFPTAATNPGSSSFRLDMLSGTHSKSSN